MYNPITTQINTTGIVIAALISVKNRVDSGCSGLRGLGIGFALFSTKGFLKFGFGPTGPLRGGGPLDHQEEEELTSYSPRLLYDELVIILTQGKLSAGGRI